MLLPLGAYQAIYKYVNKNGRWPAVNSDADAADVVAIAKQIFGDFGFSVFGEPLEVDEELVAQVCQSTDMTTKHSPS